MGFAGWGRCCELVTQHSQVTQDCTDFPVLVHEDSLPSEIFDADGSYPALNGGGDLRFSSDQAGDSQLPCEIESFVTDNDPANGKSAVWVKRTLSSASNTSIWIYYNKTGESQPAEDSAYGKENVWDSNFKMVQHMNQIPDGTADEIVDSTSNDNDGTTSGMDSADQVAGQIDGSLDFDGSNDYIDCGNNANLKFNEGTADFTISAWIKRGAITTDLEAIFDKRDSNDDGYRFSLYNNGLILSVDAIDVFSASTIEETSNFHFVTGVIDRDGNGQVYLDGSADGNAVAINSEVMANTNNPRIGRNAAGTSGHLQGVIDEVRISNVARSAGWIATEYNNQYAPSTFLIEGTPETPGVGVTIPIFMQNMRGSFNSPGTRGGFIN